jgi:surfactin synthase thioesterase subunit/acyl carrier protein
VGECFVAPCSLVHSQLVQLWEALLEVQPIGITDNFFSLGGHSLLAAQLVARIEQVFGKKLSLSALLAGPTIEQLASALEQQAYTSSRTSVIAVQRGSTRRPFFFLHGDWTGGAFYCLTLARALGEDQPFYAVEPYKIDEHHAPPSLEAMAAAHLASLHAVQPAGPYLLGGFCNGGLVAYEMARQLRVEGEQVDLLLVAPDIPTRFKWVRDAISRLGQLMSIPQKRQMEWFLLLRHLQRHVYRSVHPSSDKLQGFERVLAVDGRLNAMFPAGSALRKDYEGVFAWLNAGYLPAPYPEEITVFWTQEEPLTRTAWQKVARIKEGEVRFMPGKHLTCVTAHVHLLAELLSSYLRRVQAADGSPTPFI